MIISHGTAISFLLKKWCNVEIINNILRYSYNETILLDGSSNYCETFNLIFDNDELISIENVKFE